MKRAIVWAAASFVAFPAMAAAQGQSAIEVLSITASPSSFQPGTAVTFSIQVKNNGPRRTKGGTAYLDAFKSDRPVASEHVWGATQDVGRLDPGATAIVDFVWRNELRGAIRARAWTVPNVDTDVFVVRAGVVDPPNEFAQVKSAKFLRKCTYSKPGPITPSPRVSLTDLKRLNRPAP